MREESRHREKKGGSQVTARAREREREEDTVCSVVHIIFSRDVISEIHTRDTQVSYVTKVLTLDTVLPVKTFFPEKASHTHSAFPLFCPARSFFFPPLGLRPTKEEGNELCPSESEERGKVFFKKNRRPFLFPLSCTLRKKIPSQTAKEKILPAQHLLSRKKMVARERGENRKLKTSVCMCN